MAFTGIKGTVAGDQYFVCTKKSDALGEVKAVVVGARLGSTAEWEADRGKGVTRGPPRAFGLGDI